MRNTPEIIRNRKEIERLCQVFSDMIDQAETALNDEIKRLAGPQFHVVLQYELGVISAPTDATPVYRRQTQSRDALDEELKVRRNEERIGQGEYLPTGSGKAVA